MLSIQKSVITMGLLIIFVIASSGCIYDSANFNSTDYSNNNTTNEPSIGNSSFKIPVEWEYYGSDEKNYKNDRYISFDYKYQKNLILFVTLFSNKTAYSSSLELDKIIENSTIKKIKIGNVSVTQIKKYKTTAGPPKGVVSWSDTQYYFKKNGKFYNIGVIDYRNSSTNNNTMIKEAINSIIKTMS